MKLKLFFFSFLVLKSFLLSAQKDFRPGYIVLASGDTLIGEIDNRSEQKMNYECRFKDKQNNVNCYKPKELIAFKLDKGNCFYTKSIDSTMVFAECIIKGRLSIYYFPFKSDPRYFIESDKNSFTEIPYIITPTTEEDKVTNYSLYYKIRPTKHIGVLTYFMIDAPQLKPKIDKIKQPNHKNLIAIADLYNREIGGSSNAIVYKKQLRNITMALEPNFGVLKYRNLDKYALNTGFYFHIFSSSLNKDLFFKSGFIYARQPNLTAFETIFRIPIQLEYMYSKYTLKPKISLGVFYYRNMYYRTMTTHPCLNIGFNYTLSKLLDVSLNVESEYTSIAYLHSIKWKGKFRLTSLALNAGIFIKL